MFEIVKTSVGYASTPSVLMSFDAPGTDGTFAEAGLISDAAGDLFGDMPWWDKWRWNGVRAW